jgi:glyoxylase-like metal-dependent hydrolase (beta-lactamase superfamily II)
MSESEQGPPAPDVRPEGITEIGTGVWVIPDRRVPLVPNVGIVEGEETVLVVDAGMGPRNGALVLRAAQGKANNRPLVVTSTHFHPEHGFGLQAFQDTATIVYNRAQLDELHDKGQSYVDMFRTFGPNVASALEGVELVDPHETYDGDRHEIDLGGRTALLLTRGLAHTRGDQVVWLPEERILFTGDLVESRIFPIYPYFPPEDADVDGSRWIEVLRWLEGLEPGQVVPGHGEVRDVAVITEAREYHERLREETFALADEGVGADEAVERTEPRMKAWHPDWDQPEWIGFGVRCFHAERLRADAASGR